MKKDKVVYFHINKDTGNVFYVGEGTKKRPRALNGRNTFWHNVVNKHGYDIQIIKENLTAEQSGLIETFWISVFGRRDLGQGELVNHNNGLGAKQTGFKQSKEQIEARVKYNTGLKRTIEQIERIRKGNVGLKRTDEQKKKMSISKIGTKLSEETKKKMSETRKGRICSEETRLKISKQINAFDLNGLFIIEFNSVKEASEKLNISKTSISKVLNGSRNRAGNYKFKFK